MPRIPYPIDGTVYDSDGNTYAGAQVVIYNTTSEDSIRTTTNESGYYFIDRANATKEWSNNELIIIRAFVDGKYFKIAEVKTSMTGSSITQNLNLLTQTPDQEFTIPEHKIDLKEHDPINNAKRFIEANIAKDTRFDADDDAPIYIGLNNDSSNAPTEARTWIIIKFTYSGDNVTRIQRMEGVAWDDRATLF